jgi:tRNA (guanine-N7-)-methyltransferase
VWTDVEEYFLESLDFTRATGLFSEPAPIEPRTAEHDLDYHTHFERRTRLAGAPVWRAIFTRNATPAHEFFRIPTNRVVELGTLLEI